MDRCRNGVNRIIYGLSVLAPALVSGHASAALPQSALEPAGPVARMQLDLFNITLYISLFIFVVVGSALAYAVIRFRRKPGDGIPPQTHGNARLEIIWTAVPIVLLLFMAVPTVRMSFELAAAPAGDNVQVRVIGYQWWWAVEYPEHGFTTANEMRIPVGRPVEITLESADVIHSFWVPRLAGKVDVIPNRANTMWFQADEPGVYYGQCAEYCGTSHANMRFRVIALEPEEYDAWIASRTSSDVAVQAAATGDLAARGHDLFMNGACAACHRIDGTPAQGTVGPDLTDFGSRLTLAAGMYDNTPDNLAAWIKDPKAVKPGALMPAIPMSDADIDALVAFLQALK